MQSPRCKTHTGGGKVSRPLHDGSARHDARANVSYMLQMLTREQGLELMEQVPCRRLASPIKSRG